MDIEVRWKKSPRRPRSLSSRGATNYNFLSMERSGIAIPEIPMVVMAFLSALGTSLYILRKAKKR